jgi:hypothetical protein
MSGARHAVQALVDAGVTVWAVAAEVGVHPRTVRRWSAGTHRPAPANLAALRGLVDDLLEAVLAGDSIHDGRQGLALQRAREALTTEQEREELAVRADAIASTIAAGPRPYVPVTAYVDPFGLCRADDLDERLDAAFGRAA